MLNSNSYVAQSTMGEKYQQRNSTPHDATNDRGYLALATVTAVHTKRYTVDVVMNDEAADFSSHSSLEGKNAPKIGVSTAGFSTQYEAAYGEQIPIHKGDTVLLGFLKNNPDHPVVLRVFHNITENVGVPNYWNILPNVDSKDDDISDYLKITPIQDFHKIDKDGNFEISSHTKSFFIGQETNFDEENFDYEDLSVKSPVDKSVIPKYSNVEGGIPTYDISDGVKKNAVMQTIQVKEKYSTPKKYMAVFRDAFKDTVTNWLRIIVDAKNTALKILKAQQKANRSTYMELGADGSTTLKRQLDTRVIKGNGAKIYTNINVDAVGKITIETVDKTTKIKTSTAEVSSDISIADQESAAAATPGKVNSTTVNGTPLYASDTYFPKATTTANTESNTTTTSTDSGTRTVVSAYIAPEVEDIQLFSFPEQPKFTLFAASPTLTASTTSEIDSDTSTTTAVDNGSGGNGTGDSGASTSSENNSGTTVGSGTTISSGTSSTDTTISVGSDTTSTDTTSADASESMEETAHTTIVINPMGGGITIKTTGALSIEALKGISLSAPDGAVSISGKKGIKLESKEGYIYGTAKKQVIFKNENFSMGATELGDATFKNNMGAMNITASGEVTQGNSFATTKTGAGGSMSTFATGGISTASPSISTTGSQKMTGGATVIGNVNQIGRHVINGRFNVVAGDRDSRLHRNFALFCNFIVAMLTQFVINQVVGQLAARIPHITALLAVIDLCIGGFNAMKEAGWNGVATTLEDAAKGALIDPNSPLYGPLHEWAEKKGFGDALSIAAQVQFLTDPEPPGMGMSVMEALETIAYDTLEEKAAAWGGASVLWTVLGSPQALADMAQNIIDGLADEVAATLDPENLWSMFENAEFNALETMSANMGCNVHIVEDDEGYYNVVSTYDGTTTACLEELGHMVDTDDFSQEGSKRTNATNDNIVPGNDTVPVTNDTVNGGGNATVNGGSAQTNSIRLNTLATKGTVQLMAAGDGGSGGGSTTVTEYYTTIEDKLIEISAYYDGNVFDAVYRTEVYIDNIKGTHSAQYAYTNRKKRTVVYSGGNGGSGSGTTTTIKIEPADVVDRDQMVDRFVKRMIAENNIKQLGAADQAVRYACCSEVQAEFNTQPTAEEIETQRQQANNIRNLDQADGGGDVKPIIG